MSCPCRENIHQNITCTTDILHACTQRKAQLGSGDLEQRELRLGSTHHHAATALICQSHHSTTNHIRRAPCQNKVSLYILIPDGGHTVQVEVVFFPACGQKTAALDHPTQTTGARGHPSEPHTCTCGPNWADTCRTAKQSATATATACHVYKPHIPADCMLPQSRSQLDPCS